MVMQSSAIRNSARDAVSLAILCSLLWLSCSAAFVNPVARHAEIKFTRKVAVRIEPESSPKEGYLDDHEDDTKTGMSPFSQFESLVHQVTGNDSYRFGDVTKSALSELTAKDLNEENYQFGDITRFQVAKLEHELEDWKSENLVALPSTLFQSFNGLSTAQRKEVIVAILRLGAIGVLTWGFLSNICTAGVLSLAWTKVCLKWTAKGLAMPPSIIPISSDAALWNSFLASYTSLRIWLDPILLIVKASGTLALFLPYVKCIVAIEKRIPGSLRRKYPLFFRGIALASAFLLINLMLCGAVASLWVGAGGLSVRLVRQLSPIQ